MRRPRKCAITPPEPVEESEAKGEENINDLLDAEENFRAWMAEEGR
jgi:hypothetical protein